MYLRSPLFKVDLKTEGRTRGTIQVLVVISLGGTEWAELFVFIELQTCWLAGLASVAIVPYSVTIGWYVLVCKTRLMRRSRISYCSYV